MFDASLIFVGAGIGFIAWWTTRFQLCEAGFWRAGRLILWSDIEGYEITEIGALSLKVNGKSLKFYCDVPPAIRQQAEELLASKRKALQAKD
jgi:hypothetical protein